MKLNVTEVLKLLPKTNCKECGEPTCMVFATKVLRKESKVADCKPLLQSDFTVQRQALEQLLAAA
jgi:CO dehydrogenase/acetyl-CoA synthase gamma subunit (corrinoid Fe-S protein)